MIKTILWDVDRTLLDFDAAERAAIQSEKGSKTHERNTLPFDVIPYPNKYLSFPRSSDRRSFECEGSRIWDTV